MLVFKPTAKFKKDVKRLQKQGKDLRLLHDVIEILLEDSPLDPSYHDHALIGNYAGFRECHIAPDWLLIYAKDEHVLTLTASRSGSHSDVF